MVMKKRLALFLVMAMVLSTFAACGAGEASGDKGADAPVEISFWIPTGEDATYYDSYDENPVVKYLESLEYNGKKIDLKFVVPVSGSELDNFNTLLATEEYCGLINMNISTMSTAELYEDGFIWDLTPYLDEYMPNYSGLMKKYPELAPYMYSAVNGEKKVLNVAVVLDEALANFMGFQYRRDWIVKYGKHPETGAAFTSGYTDPADTDTYYDDVVFPSGGTDPVYISDWEWMFEIFDAAMADLGITDGYCLSMYYMGYMESGELFNAFGGSNPMWYRDLDGKAAFAGTSENMKSYLLCLNNWYEKGWLDKAFAEHTSDQAFSIDVSKIHTGKVGMWVGRVSQTGTQIDSGEELTKGAVVFGARPPINDVYGAPETQGQTPYSLYQKERAGGMGVVVSNKISEEDLPTVLTFLDYLFTPEGGALCSFGLNKEQFESVQDETYIKFGLQDGAYSLEVLEDGTHKVTRNDILLSDSSLGIAVSGKRMNLGYYPKGFSQGQRDSYTLLAQNAIAQWDYYINTGTIQKSLRSHFTADESAMFNKVHNNVNTHMSINIPKFIRGELDVNGSDWDDYCKLLNKYSPEKVTRAYQRVFDEMS